MQVFRHNLNNFLYASWKSHFQGEQIVQEKIRAHACTHTLKHKCYIYDIVYSDRNRNQVYRVKGKFLG